MNSRGLRRISAILLVLAQVGCVPLVPSEPPRARVAPRAPIPHAIKPSAEVDIAESAVPAGSDGQNEGSRVEKDRPPLGQTKFDRSVDPHAAEGAAAAHSPTAAAAAGDAAARRSSPRRKNAEGVASARPDDLDPPAVNEHALADRPTESANVVHAAAGDHTAVWTRLTPPTRTELRASTPRRRHAFVDRRFIWEEVPRPMDCPRSR